MERVEIEKGFDHYMTANNGDYRKHYSPESLDNMMADFAAGADWRIDSVWHDARKDIPEEGRFCAYVLSGGIYGCGYYCARDNTIWCEQFSSVASWAYFDDLVPNKEDGQ